MFKLAKWLGLLGHQEISSWSKIKQKIQKKPNNSNNLPPNAPTNPPKAKFRWKPFVIVLVIGTIIGIIIYFSVFAGASTFVAVKNFSLSKPTDAVTELTIVDTGNSSKKINLNANLNPTSTLAEPGDKFDVFSNTTNNAGYIRFRVSYGNNADTSWFQLGEERIFLNFKTGLYLIGSPGNGFENIKDTVKPTENKGFNQSELSSLFTYLNTARLNAELPKQSFFISLLPQLIFLIIIILLWILVFRWLSRSQAGNQDSIFGVGKTSAKNVKMNVTFKDVAGIKEEKEELLEIVDYLKNPRKYSVMGARPPRGVILYGPPGTGKTLLAKAVSGEADVPFFEVSGASFDDMFVGVGAKRVRDLFNQAKKRAPCIIFIDEIDAVAGKRGSKMVSGSSGGIADQTINQLLSELDGFNTMAGIVVMAATNRLDSLDEAILRPGRFDRMIQVTLPDIKERIEILRIHSRNKNLSSRIDLEDIARRTPGFSGAQLENVLNEATLLAVRLNKNTIGMVEIDEAIDRVIAGPAKKSRRTTLLERKKIAFHEAGHAVAGLYANNGDVVEKITIIPRGQAGGYTLSAPEKQELLLKSKSDLLAIVTTTLAGRASEEVVYGSDQITSGAANDFYKVTNIVRAMVTQLGMSRLGLTQFIPSEGEQNPYSKLYSDVTAKAIDDEIEFIISQQYKNAKKIVSEHMDEVKLIVECLLLLETIVRKQINYIHKNKKLPLEAIEVKRKIAQEQAEHKAVFDPLEDK